MKGNLYNGLFAEDDNILLTHLIKHNIGNEYAMDGISL
jgi:hypothetical protein